MSFEGFMGKRGGVDGKAKWRRRYFVLQGTTLSYYAKKGDATPKGSLSLTEAYVVPSSAQRRPLCFQVVCPERTYYFEPDDPAERKQWIQSIKSAIPPDEAALRPKILHSGGLLKLGGKTVGGKKTKWQRRFCCVQDGELVYYLKPRNMFPPEKRQGTISLTGATLVENVADRQEAFEIRTGGKVYFFDIPPPVHSVLRRASQVFQFKEEDKMDLEDQADAQESYAQWIAAISIGIPSKVFGVPFELALQRSRSSETQMVPEPLLMAFKWINEYALREEGLYRVPGSKVEVEKFISQYDAGKAVQPPPGKFFGGNLASLVVQFLKRCPESLFSDQYSQVFEQITTEYNAQKQPKHLVMMKKLLTMIPPVNFAIIRSLGEHLLEVAKYSGDNNMTIDKLAMCVYTRMSLTLQMCLENFEFLFGQAKPAPEEVEELLRETIRRVTIAHAPKYEEGDDSDEEEIKSPKSPKDGSDSD